MELRLRLNLKWDLQIFTRTPFGGEIFNGRVKKQMVQFTDVYMNPFLNVSLTGCPVNFNWLAFYIGLS